MNLREAVIAQLECEPEEVTELLAEIAQHGAAGGFHGFISTRDNLQFFADHQGIIRQALLDSAEDSGSDPIEFVQNFTCFNDVRAARSFRPVADDIGRVLWGPADDVRNAPPGSEMARIGEALAWFALEIVAG